MENTSSGLRNSRVETVFYLTLLVTVVQAGFILWDLAAMLPGFGALVGLKEPNKIQTSSLMSNLYLALLGIYAGYKEFLRWTGGPDGQEVPEEQVKRFRRGELIVTFWVVLAVIGLSIWQLRLIERMPNELFRTALQALGIMFGTYASKGLYGKAKKKSAETVMAESDARQKVIGYIKAKGSIDSEECRKECGLDRGRAYRLLEKLEKEGLIKSEGVKKGAKYVLPVV